MILFFRLTPSLFIFLLFAFSYSFLYFCYILHTLSIAIMIQSYDNVFLHLQIRFRLDSILYLFDLSKSFILSFLALVDFKVNLTFITIVLLGMIHCKFQPLVSQMFILGLTLHVTKLILLFCSSRVS